MIASTNASKRAATPARVRTTKHQSPARKEKSVRAAPNAPFSVALGSNQPGRALDIAPANGDSGPHLVVAIYIYQ
jgi:hypothetical protein